MTSWNAGWRFPLYLCIWLAVIVTVGLLTIAVGFLRRANSEQTPMREVIICDQNDVMIGQSMVRPSRARAWSSTCR